MSIEAAHLPHPFVPGGDYGGAACALCGRHVFSSYHVNTPTMEDPMTNPAPVAVPTVGRIVHYRPSERELLPAIVTRVHEMSADNDEPVPSLEVDLEVFGLPTVVERLQTAVTHADKDSFRGHTWHWPEVKR